MPTISPHTIALLGVLVVALIGSIIAYVRDHARFRGYEELTREALRLARALKGEVFRDGEDLVASGSWEDLPVQIRFSHSLNTPGLHIRMGAPSGFLLSVASVRAPQAAGRMRVRTPDENFNSRFLVRSDQPSQVHFFLSDGQVMGAFRNLCGSANSFLFFSSGLIEFGELGHPTQQSARDSLQHLENMGRLAEKLASMPGSQAIQIEKLKRGNSWVIRFALAVGIIASVAGLIMESRSRPAVAAAPIVHKETGGLSVEDAQKIPGMANWHLARADELDPAALTWARSQRSDIESRVTGDFCSTGRRNDVAFLLVGPESSRRVVLICDGENVYDSKYPYIGIAVRVPKEQIRSIQWSVKPSEDPENDALLITRAPDDPASGLVLFIRGHRLVTGVPLNYQSVKLE